MNRESLYQIPRHADSESLLDKNTDAERDFINKVLSKKKSSNKLLEDSPKEKKVKRKRTSGRKDKKAEQKVLGSECHGEVMIVDDCEFNQLTMGAAFKTQYHLKHIDQAMNGKSACEMFKKSLTKPRECCG